MAMTLSETSKGGECLILEGFKYRRVKRASETEKTWRCCQRMCPAQLVTDAKGATLLIKQGMHSHDELTERQKEMVLVSAACKRAAIDSLDCRPRNILCKVVRGTDHLVKPDTVNIAKSMYRAKRKLLPTLPTNRPEAVEQIGNLNIRTSKGELFRFVNEEAGIILFTCATNLRLLADSETWLADGTFEFAADKFYQLYTIHGHKDGYNVPVASFCLADKKGATYISMFEMLKEVARTEASAELRPTQLLLDFEDAPRAAASKVFPNISVRACRFHFVQNLVKRIRSNPALLKVFNKKGNEHGQWLHAFLGLPCLPPHMIEDAFLELMSCAPQEAEYAEFSDYVLETYIETSRYCPNLWSRAPSMTEPTSTNAAEKYNCRYNDDHTSAHPNIHRTVQALLDLQEEVSILERTIRTGLRFTATTQSLKVKQATVEAWDALCNGEITMYEYLVCVGTLNKTLKTQKQN